MRKIKLTQGKYALVDNEDFEWLSQWKWHYSKGYAVRSIPRIKNISRQFLRMHRLICKTPKGMDTDHINGNKLDNQRSNLRICTRSQNMGNIRKHINNPLKYKGVSWSKEKNKWQVRIKKYFLGYFKDPKEGAKAYNQKAQELFGKFALLNNI